MDALGNYYRFPDPGTDGQYRTTHRSVIERLADPYLTEHDRWVLRQFARFLSGTAPDPDPRVTPTLPERPVYTRVRCAHAGAPQRSAET
jgi:hypothetical protein